MTMKDRLTELRQRQGKISEDVGDTGGASNRSKNDSVSSKMKRTGSVVGLEQVLMQVADTTKMINDLRGDVHQVTDLHKHILSTGSLEQRKKTELNDLSATIKTSTRIIRSRLKDMEKSNLKADGNDDNSASSRIRHTQHSALLKNFIDVINEYQLAQTEYTDGCKSQIRRQLEIADSDLPEHDVDEMIEQGNFSVFTQSILLNTEQAKQGLADVEARHKEILNLEKSLKEIHDLFIEMAMLVEQQGATIDRIETHVAATQEYTEKSKGTLKQAKDGASKLRKKKTKLIVALSVVAAVVIPILFI